MIVHDMLDKKRKNKISRIGFAYGYACMIGRMHKRILPILSILPLAILLILFSFFFFTNFSRSEKFAIT